MLQSTVCAAHDYPYERPLEKLHDKLRGIDLDGLDSLRQGMSLTPYESACVGFVHAAMHAPADALEGVLDSWAAAMNPEQANTRRELAFWEWADANLESALCCADSAAC